MRFLRLSSISFLTLAGVLFLFAGCDSSKPGGGEAETKVSFVDDVKPLLETHCIRCHNDENLFGGLNLMTREKAFKGSVNGPVLIPGEPDKSLLLAATSLDHGKDPKAMPATGPTLTDEEKEIIRKWIAQGADWPEGKEGNMAPLQVEPNKV